MKKFYALLLSFIFLNPGFIFSQKQANHWYFGMFSGLDFTNGAPVADTTGKLNTAEGCSAISDANGNLLLYTDGITVFNRVHDTLPNGTGLTGDISSTQSALIVPQPNHSNTYYIFTTAADGGIAGFRYSKVDMTLDGGLGDITSKNVLIKNFSTEKVSAVSNPNGTGYWVMMHEWGTNGFYAYFLSDTGLNMTPVVSHTGSVHGSGNFQNTYGQMKFSADGHKVALGIGYQQIFELFDFDNSTGVVSNPVTFNTGHSSYGVEFSPDNTKLYITRYDNLNDLYYLDQFNLSAGDSSQIVASQYPISTTDGMRQLQLGPDGKIYVAKFNVPYLGVIDNPNGLGAASNYQDNAFLLDSSQSGLILCGLGLPGFVQTFFNEPAAPVSAFTADDTIICPGTCVNFHDLSLNNVNQWHWSFPGGTPDTSSAQNPQTICYPSAGFYPVTLITGNGFGYDTTNVNAYVRVHQAPPISISVNGDTMDAYNAVSYQWYKSGNLIPGANNPEYIAPTSGSYTVVVTDANGCTATSNAIIINATGIKEANPGGIKIYPVPASDNLYLTLPFSGGSGTFSIKNLLGEELLWGTITGNSGSVIGVKELPAASYILSLTMNNGFYQARFLKE